MTDQNPKKTATTCTATPTWTSANTISTGTITVNPAKFSTDVLNWQPGMNTPASYAEIGKYHDTLEEQFEYLGLEVVDYVYTEDPLTCGCGFDELPDVSFEYVQGSKYWGHPVVKLPNGETWLCATTQTARVLNGINPDDFSVYPLIFFLPFDLPSMTAFNPRPGKTGLCTHNTYKAPHPREIALSALTIKTHPSYSPSMHKILLLQGLCKKGDKNGTNNPGK